MKKLFFAAALICTTLAFSSCNKDTLKCWEVTYKSSNIQISAYVYATENQIDATYGNYSGFSKKSVNKSQSDCAMANLK